MRRTILTSGLLGLSALIVSGCMGPTYGTDKPATTQLLEDVSSAVTLAPKRSEPIAYTPRPALVQPASTTVLPTPQQSATVDNSAWPESPEQRRARLRAEATANQHDNLYRSPIRSTQVASTSPDGLDRDFSQLSAAEQRQEVLRRQAMRQGSPTTRRFLSEPPLDYRVPAETAPADELGEDEWRKERNIRRASGSSSWRDWVPWL